MIAQTVLIWVLLSVACLGQIHLMFTSHRVLVRTNTTLRKSRRLRLAEGRLAAGESALVYSEAADLQREGLGISQELLELVYVDPSRVSKQIRALGLAVYERTVGRNIISIWLCEANPQQTPQVLRTRIRPVATSSRRPLGSKPIRGTRRISGTIEGGGQ